MPPSVTFPSANAHAAAEAVSAALAPVYALLGQLMYRLCRGDHKESKLEARLG